MLKTEAGEEVFDPPTVYDRATWTAFFTNVPHEVEPVTKGFRVFLSYNLLVRWTVGTIIPRAPTHLCTLRPSACARAPKRPRTSARWFRERFLCYPKLKCRCNSVR